MTALYAFQALSAALYARRDETHGRYIEASLMQGAAWLNSYATLQRVIFDGDWPAARAHRGVYATADGWILVIVAGRRGWQDFCKALQQPELGDDARFITPMSRIAHTAVLTPILSEILALQPTTHWQARFTEYGVMHSVVNESLDLLRDPHVEATGLFSYLAQPGLEMKMPIPSIPGAAPLESGTPRATSPLAGAGTEAVLRAHGYGEAEIADLQRRGVVST
jgi:crotonobetainyl-CoA:carnitine CoA-transferase CaiB-like acyl-CoA transferase